MRDALISRWSRGKAIQAMVLLACLFLCASHDPAWSQGVGERLRSFFPGQKPPPPPRLVIVFADISGSIPQDDWNIYEKTYFSLVGPPQGREEQAGIRKGKQDGPGDRLILGTISEGSLTNFSAVVDGELKDTGRIFADRKVNEDTLNNLRTAWGKIRAMKAARRTLILDALTLSQQLIDQNKDRSYVIVLLSDMLEDSSVVSFEKKPPTVTETETIIKQQKTRGLMPDLHGAKVYVAGAKAPTSAHYVAVQAFWTRYLKEANATVELGTYGRSAIDFLEAWRQRP